VARSRRGRKPEEPLASAPKPLPSRWAEPSPDCKHPKARLEVHECDLGGCPEEGMPFESENRLLCGECRGWVACGTTEVLAYLLKLVQAT
jgi:hypothetical protein